MIRRPPRSTLTATLLPDTTLFRSGQAYVTATVAVWDDDPRIADEKLRLVEKVIQGRDFTAMTETINAVDAWLGSLPGHVYANVRQPPIRSEERRVGKECVSTCRSRWSPYP